MPVPSVKFIKTDSSTQANISQKRKVFYAGYFDKGSPNTFTPVYSILDFKTKFGKPIKENLNDWFLIYNYFQYNNKEIILSRCVGEDSINSSVSYPYKDFDIRIDNLTEFRGKQVISNRNILRILARNPGSWGDDLTVAIFSRTELDLNKKIFKNLYAKDIQSLLSKDQYCVCVFQRDNLIEKYVIGNKNDSCELINDNSNYIYIIFKPEDYKCFDGNIHYVDGLKITADGNEPNNVNPVFYGSGCLKLSGGYSALPEIENIENNYRTIGESDDYIFDFILANENHPNAAIDLADTRGDCCAFIGVPHRTDPEEYIKKLKKSENAILYFGSKLQRNPFNNQNIFVNCIGDILGLRTYLINNSDLSESHCKTTYNFLNSLGLDINLTEIQIRDLYNQNINIVKKGYNGIYALSENMLLGQKLTNQVIHYNLTRDCEELAKYYVFEHNDTLTRNDLASKIKEICRKYKADNNIDDFKVICDISNNPTPDVNLYLDVYYKPKFVVEEIHIRLQAVTKL